MDELATQTSSTPQPPQRFLPPPRVPDHELLRPIGRGSYGEVWLARSATGAYRAVKIVYRHSFDSERPFEREFSGLLKFEPISRKHDSQVGVLHVGRAEDYFYYVLELADDQFTGPQILPDSYAPRTLQSELLQHGRLAADECLRISLALTRALEHLHSHKLVHRDVKPSNIIFVDGVPKLADIGLVTGVDATRSFVGTEGFTPPEGPGTPQADIHSLGKVLYEALTGKDRQQFPELPSELREWSDREAILELNAVVAKACRADPRERYNSAGAMHQELLLLQSGRSLARLRTLDRAFSTLKRASLTIAVVTVVAIGAFIYQSRQTRVVKKLATENLRLAKDSQQNANASQEHLTQLQIANGTRAMEERDFSTAMLWFAKALERAIPNSEAERIERDRIGTLFRYSPRLIQIWAEPDSVHNEMITLDGKRFVAFCGTDHQDQVTIRDLLSGEPLQTIGLTNNWGSAMSPSGRWLLMSDRSSARVWDVAGARAACRNFSVSNPSRTVFSPDERRLALVEDRTVRMFEVPSGRPLGSPLEHSNAVRFVRFSPDSSRIATGCGADPVDPWGNAAGGARVWDASSGHAVTGWLDPSHWAVAGEFSPDGRKLVTIRSPVSGTLTRGTHLARVWDSATGGLLAVSPPHTDAILKAVFAPDGLNVATASGDGSVMLWDSRTGEPVLPPLKHDSMVEGLAFSPDGRQLATLTRDAVRVWETRTGRLELPPLKHSGKLGSAGFSPDGARLWTVSWNHEVRVWDLSPIEPGLPPFRKEAWFDIVATTLSPDGKRVATLDSSLSGVQIWDAESGQPVAFLGGGIRRGAGAEGFVEFSPDGSRVVSISNNDRRAARIWDASTGRELVPPLGHGGEVATARFSPDGRKVVTASWDGTARLWDSFTGQPLCALLRHADAVRGVAFSPDGHRVVTGSMDSTARVWDADHGTPLTSPLQHGDAVYGVAFSPDGARVATASRDTTAAVWDARTGLRVVGLAGHFAAVIGVAFSPDGHELLTTSLDGSARIWDAFNGKPIARPLKHADCVTCASFSPDGRRVVTASMDGAVRVWSAITGDPVSLSFKHHAQVCSACFTPDGSRVLTGSWDSTAQLWDLPTLTWARVDISMLAELSAGAALDNSGRSQPLETAALEQTWRKLKASHPDQFRPKADELVLWHRRELVTSEIAQQWFAARFHLEKLEALSPNDPTLERVRSGVLACQPVPRDPTTPPDLIDLTDYYNTSLRESWSSRHEQKTFRQNLAGLPIGVQTVAGVKFDVRGAIRLAECDRWELDRRVPPRVTGIRVAQRCKRLHFLHVKECGNDPVGTTLGSYVVRYANHQQWEIPIVYGEDTGGMGGSGTPLEGKNFASQSIEESLRVYRRTWENPEPDVEIESIDFNLNVGHDSPVLLAVTAE